MSTAILTMISAFSGTLISLNGIILALGDARNIGTFLTIVLGLILIFIAIFMKVIKRLLIYPLFKMLWIVFCFLFIAGLFSSSMLYLYGRTDTATYKEDYLVVLGCGLHGTEPSETLIKRLDEAVTYANRNTDCKIIVTGGMGTGEDIPEAEAMYNYLTDKGVNPERIIQETQATSTTENFEFSNRLTNGDLQNKSAVFITNDFHIYRANSLAKLQGLSMNHLSAKTPLHSIIPSYLRENLALVQMIVFNK